MSFLKDYALYNSDNECPREFHIWSAISIVAATLGRRVRCSMGYFTIHPNLYIVLVGGQGSRKSTAKDIARDMFIEACPDIPIGASVQSREDIVKFMASDNCIRAYTDENGQPIEWRPLVIFANELKNFLSIDPGKMIDFMTDIYDRAYFDASTIKHGLQKILNPCINFLACETPKWIVNKLKSDIISGGFSRRVIYVYITDESSRIPFPEVSDAAKAARERCVKHLQKISTLAGEFTWDEEAKKFYSEWYKNLKPPNDDDVMAGYYKSKHIQLIKIVMGLAACEPEPKLVITETLLRMGIVFLDKLEVNMPKLFIAAGRNELAVPQQRILELLRDNKGFMREKQLKILLDKDLNPMEQFSLFKHLQEATGQITKVSLVRGQGQFSEIWLTEDFQKAVREKRIIQGADGKPTWVGNGT